MAPKPGRRPQDEDDLLEWFTVTYRSIFIAGGLLVAVVLAIGWYYFYSGRPASRTRQAAPTAPAAAHFTSIEGSVQVRALGTFEWVAADKDGALRKGDLIRTGSNTAAEVTFFDGATVRIRPEGLFTIEELSEDPSTKKRKVGWEVRSGEVHFKTVRRNVPGSETEFVAPTFKGKIDEMSSGSLHVGEAGDADMRLFQGLARMQTKAGQVVDLGASEGVKVDATGKAGPKVTLPGIPTPLAPAHQAEVAYPDPTRATTLLLWKAVAGAVSYHLMLDSSAYFNRPLVDRKGIQGNEQELRGLEPGKYYWRIAAIDKAGQEGAFSDFARFTVADPSGRRTGDATPPLTIESMDLRSNILQIKGKTEPGGTVTVDGKRVDVNGDGSFNDFIQLEKPGKQVVVIRANGLNGGVNEQRRPVVVGE